MNSSIVISLLGVIGFAIFTMQSYYTTISRMETVFPATVAPGAVGIIFYFLCILIPLIIYLYLLKGEKKVSWMAVS